MIKHRSQLLCAWFLLGDLALSGLAWVGAYHLRFETSWLPFLPPGQGDWSLCWANLPLVLLLTAAAGHFTGQYAIDRLRRLREEAFSVLKGTALLGLFVLATIVYRQDPYHSRLTLTLFFGLTVLGLLTGRRLGQQGAPQECR